jgi:hypothetical protein
VIKEVLSNSRPLFPLKRIYCKYCLTTPKYITAQIYDGLAKFIPHAIISVGNAESYLNVEITTVEKHSRVADALPAKNCFDCIREIQQNENRLI